MLIYFIRHGQTEGNKKRVFQTPSTPLSPDGEVQASKLAERLKGVELNEIWTSPLLRAKQTAEIINQYHHVPVSEHLELQEIRYPSSFEGKSEEELPGEENLNEVIRKQKTDPTFKYKDAESFEEVIKRAQKLLQQIEAVAAEKPNDFALCICTHGLMLSTLLFLIMLGPETPSKILQRGIWNIWQENTSISFATLTEGQWKLMTIGDFAHL